MNGRYRGLGRFLSLVLVLTVLCSGVALADCATDNTTSFSMMS